MLLLGKSWILLIVFLSLIYEIFSYYISSVMVYILVFITIEISDLNVLDLD